MLNLWYLVSIKAALRKLKMQIRCEQKIRTNEHMHFNAYS